MSWQETYRAYCARLSMAALENVILTLSEPVVDAEVSRQACPALKSKFRMAVNERRNRRMRARLEQGERRDAA